MKTIKSSKDITTLEVGDVVVFGNLKYKVNHEDGYFLSTLDVENDKIFTILNISKRDFVKNLGINTLPIDWDFPEVCSLEALTAIVSALFKEYEKQKELPKTWEEFCERYPLKAKEVFINSASKIITVGDYISRGYRTPDNDRNLCTSREEGEAFIALMQLRQLRKAYVKDWEPDWNNDDITKFCINFECEEARVVLWSKISHVLSFPNRELATQFLNNFKDLIKIAKPLL